MKQKKLWGGRFSQPTHQIVEKFSASVDIDKRLYRQDIAGSLAHAQMLQKTGLLTASELHAIESGLNEIRQQIELGKFEWSQEYEDVHMNIEGCLINMIGEAGKKLHTGRSRNDQVATDMRLYLREEIDLICQLLTTLQQTLITLALRETNTIMPGLTHMQGAQPITFGHHMLAWNQMLERDYERLMQCRARTNVSPLGSAALAGTSYPIDRDMTARALGFDAPSPNSLDAVSDRDFIIEFNAAAALLMIHLSRMAEELVLWSCDAFGFVDLGDAFCTGSSIMPQKKNPDVAELIRGKCSRVNGNLHALLMLMKGQPLAYNRDNQEDKQPLFDSIDTVQITLDVSAKMLADITINREAMYAMATQGYATATDMADYLVNKQIPFRDAHEIVGQVVASAIKSGLRIDQLSLETLQSFCPKIDADVYDVLTLEGSVNARNHIGGTAPTQVKIAAQAAQQKINIRK